MVKKKQLETESSESTKTESASAPVKGIPLLPETGFGVAQDQDGNWCTYVINYNAFSGDAKVKEVLRQPSKGSAVERFKILVGQSNILD